MIGIKGRFGRLSTMVVALLVLAAALSGCAVGKAAVSVGKGVNNARSEFLPTGNRLLLENKIDAKWASGQTFQALFLTGSGANVFASVPIDDTFGGCEPVLRLIPKGPQGGDPTEADSYFVLWAIDDFDYLNLHTNINFGLNRSSKVVLAKDVPELAAFTDNATHTANGHQPSKATFYSALKGALKGGKYPRLNAICSIK